MRIRSVSLDYVKSTTPSLIGIVLLIMGVILAIGCWRIYDGLSSTNQELDNKIAHLQSGRNSLPSAAAPRVEKLSDEQLAAIKDAHNVVDFLYLPWSAIFDALEEASEPDVALLSIEPDAKRREVKITAQAKDTNTLFDYLKRLNNSSKLSGAFLVRHELTEDENKQHPILFVVIAEWKDKK